MRKLKTEKIIKIDNEAVIRLNINKATGESMVTVASGYVSAGTFFPLEDFREYKVKGHKEEQPEDVYFAEVDKQNSPSITMFGLVYRAREKGIKVAYLPEEETEGISASVTGKTIEVKVDPLVTTNQEIINMINSNVEIMTLIYELEAIDIDADVDICLASMEIKG